MNKKITLSIFAIACMTNLNALEFKPVGYKAIGMGGAGVASTRGSLSGYYNPALLRFSDYTSEVSLNVGVNIRESGIVNHIDTLNNIEFENTLDKVATDASSSGGTDLTTSKNIKTAQSTLSQIGASNALGASVTPSLSAQISDSFAIGIYGNANVGARLNIDANRLDIIVKNNNQYFKYDTNANTYSKTNQTDYENNSLEYAVDNGLTYLDVNAMALTEIPVSLANSYELNNGTVSFGINAKAMGLVTSTQKVKLGKSSEDIDDDLSTYETEYKPTIGLDLGIAYMLKESSLTLGLVGKNINNPKFKVDGTSPTGQGDYTIDAMYRAGFSLPLFEDTVEFAFDVDLTKNETLIADEDSQMIGGGVEFHPSSWFAFRVGAMQDIASEKFDDGTILTTGLGFGLKWAQIDLSAMMSTKNGEYEGDSIPRYTAINLAIVSRWGDGYNKKEVPEKNPYEHVKQRETLTPAEQKRLQLQSEKAQHELNMELKK